MTKSLQRFIDWVPLLPETKLLLARKPRTGWKSVPMILLVFVRNVVDYVHSDLTAMSFDLQVLACDTARPC